ncbi:MAG: hypothetical protein HC769_02720 [Cyanobacteria bacterium CRU_2_1]|nr:hypothetical protein [Cyanobacteria bacterium RU_5_0]NJR57858.1 hypothetical protein [Cyanobacteria bacterium CRU_2_1]
MVWIMILIGIFVVLVSLFATATPVQAAIPPLNSTDSHADATHIIIGTVKTISQQEVSTEEGNNYEFVATVEIIQVEKQPLHSADLIETADRHLGDTVEVHYWQTGKRPFGWTGPQGQNAKLPPNTQVRLFLRLGVNDRLSLLEPNGWEIYE